MACSHGIEDDKTIRKISVFVDVVSHVFPHCIAAYVKFQKEWVSPVLTGKYINFLILVSNYRLQLGLQQNNIFSIITQLIFFYFLLIY